MALRNIVDFTDQLQDKDMSKVHQDVSFRHFVKDLVNEHGVYQSYNGMLEGLYVNVYALPMHDKRILLSHMVDADEYEALSKTLGGIKIAIDELSDEMQDILNARAAEVFAEKMEEMGAVMYQHSDNGDYYWTRS